jgi:hypothetical protein
MSLGLQMYRVHIQTEVLRTEQMQMDRLQQRVDALVRSKLAPTPK